MDNKLDPTPKQKTSSTTPDPDQLNSSVPSADAGTPSVSPTVPPAKRSKLPLKLLAGILLLVVVAVAGFFGYKALTGDDAAPQAKVKKEIPLITYGYQSYGSDNALYPAATNLDPNYDVNQQIFEGLVQFKDINQIKPSLAVSWTNPDDSTWDFKLAKDVKFHTGRTMTATDVKYSLENFNTSEYGKIYGSTIKSVEVVNDDEVKVVTNGPDPLLLNKLVFLYIIDSKSELENDAANGTGPYTLKPDTTPSEEQLDLVAFDDWHGGRPLTRAITFKVYADEAAQLAAAQKGEINFVPDVFEKENQEAYASSSSPVFQDISFQHIGETVLRINSRKPNSPLADKRVREALYDSLDQTALLKARGLDAVVVNQVVPQDVPGYNPDIPEHKRDVEKAKALLAEAGYPNGIDVELLYLNNGSQFPTEAAKQAKEAGINLSVNISDDPDALEAAIAAGKTEVVSYSINTTLLDASDVFSAYLQGQDYNNPVVNDLAAQASKTIDPAKRLTLLQEISKTLMDDVAIMPMYSRVQHFYTDPSFVVTRDRGGAAFGVNFATVYAK